MFKLRASTNWNVRTLFAASMIAERSGSHGNADTTSGRTRWPFRPAARSANANTFTGLINIGRTLCQIFFAFIIDGCSAVFFKSIMLNYYLFIKLIFHFRTYSHSAMLATHISLLTNCFLHSDCLAMSGFRYWRWRWRNPLPHVTEHGVHSLNSVTSHSANRFH